MADRRKRQGARDGRQKSRRPGQDGEGERGRDRDHGERRDGGERPAARSFWSGTLSFGLVSIPVDVLSATARRGVPMRMLAADGAPLRRRYICPRDGAALRGDDLVRGYEYQRGRFVTVTDEELEALEPGKSRDISLRRFVPREAIPPLYFERSYFLAPSGGSAKAYHLLAETMAQSGRAGVATFVMREKEYLVAITAEGGVLRGEILRFADEVRSAEDIGLPAPGDGDPHRTQAIGRDIDALRAPLDRDELRDREADLLIALAERKYAGGTDVVRAPEAEEESDEPGEVVDLMQVLKERLGASAEAKPAQRAPRGGQARGVAGGDRARADASEREQSREELYERARALGIRGRSRMTKDELADAIKSADRLTG